ncbi:hypothetical protein BLOT_008919 [Blomia tropicalis]|nr:hypothetical protein BLOT_008919 [Blomia tropicalis]
MASLGLVCRPSRDKDTNCTISCTNRVDVISSRNQVTSDSSPSSTMPDGRGHHLVNRSAIMSIQKRAHNRSKSIRSRYSTSLSSTVNSTFIAQQFKMMPSLISSSSSSSSSPPFCVFYLLILFTLTSLLTTSDARQVQLNIQHLNRIDANPYRNVQGLLIGQFEWGFDLEFESNFPFYRFTGLTRLDD